MTEQEKQDFLIELENKHQAMAFEAIEARKRAGLAVTADWLDALERKQIAMALQEIAVRDLAEL